MGCDSATELFYYILFPSETTCLTATLKYEVATPIEYNV
ncbi:hypothetical protein SAMN05421858_0668 [Haladaptatus litoreus]|uniref:Uncharacterized protein n=1 Tax=Haladaptatus litoreus TaxID=553468 RepID=A0A1N6WC65_9EURY|nr:hypothetical protein SAMN05421858_0668 [Haladaptatus litoreus]